MSFTTTCTPRRASGSAGRLGVFACRARECIVRPERPTGHELVDRDFEQTESERLRVPRAPSAGSRIGRFSSLRGAVDRQDIDLTRAYGVAASKIDCPFVSPASVDITLIGYALGNPLRVALLEALGDREVTLSDVARAFGISCATAHRHVCILAHAKLVLTARRGRWRVLRRDPRCWDAIERLVAASVRQPPPCQVAIGSQIAGE